ncbi:MAG: hypothetical protein ABR957_00095 [Terracidiphilus sp.]|jgi:hypothetical protein
MWTSGRVLLEFTAVLITAGGLYDVFTPRLPSNLKKICGVTEGAHRLTRELLRALGGSLTAIGVAVGYVVIVSGPNPDPSVFVLVLVLVLPAELINAFSMYRVGSPFYFPLAFALLTILGVALWWPHHLR